MNRPDEPCIADGCRKRSEKGRKYCHGHRKREKQHRPLTPLREYGLAPNKYVEAKALGLANAKDDERAYELARKRFWSAVFAYIRKRQKVPKSLDTASRG